MRLLSGGLGHCKRVWVGVGDVWDARGVFCSCLSCPCLACSPVEGTGSPEIILDAHTCLFVMTMGGIDG